MILKKIFNKLKQIFIKFLNFLGLDITNDGERVALRYGNLDIAKMDMYQRAHYERYLYAQNLVTNQDLVGDMACGTGYGTMLLAEKSRHVSGYDINKKVIQKISALYRDVPNVVFIGDDLLNVAESNKFDKIVSFETIEHLPPDKTQELFNMFYRVLKPGGKLIFSTPYMQAKSANAIKMGFHLVFDIDEKLLVHWLQSAGFQLDRFAYQNYKTSIILDTLEEKDFIIGIASK